MRSGQKKLVTLGRRLVECVALWCHSVPRLLTSPSGTGHRMLREVMFASAVWSCVLPNVSEAVEAFVLMHAAAVGCSRARRKAILYTHTFLSLFGLSAGKTRQGGPQATRQE